MRSKSIVSCAALLAVFCGCAQIAEPLQAPVEPEQTAENFVSKVSGETISLSAVKPSTIIVKVNDVLSAQIEECNADLTVLGADVKSMEAPFAKIRPVRMERLFPYAGEFEERTREAGLHRWYKIEFDETVSLAEAEVALSKVSDIVELEFDFKETIADDQVTYPVAYPSESPAEALVFNDPYLANQWHYYNDGSRSGMKAGSDIDVMPVWDSYAAGNSDVIVSIVDGGIDITHEDLAANIWTSSDGIHGYNYVDGNHNIVAHSHGTHVAGTVAAVNNNEIGVSGVAGGDAIKGVPGVKLMSCQIFKTGPDGKDQGSGSGYQGIKWGADHGAVISQNSWSYVDAPSMPSYCAEAIDYFIKYAGMDKSGKNQLGPMAGGVVIFAAGNDNTNISYPGAYAPVIAVSSIGADYQRAYYSNFGDWCDIIAPGGDAMKDYNVLSTLPGGKYGYMQGTSMACPHVSGVAALIVSNMGGPGFTNKRLEELLITTVNTEVLEYNTLPLGAGLVSATNAIAYNKPVEHVIEPEGSSNLNMKAPQTRQIAFLTKNPTGHDLKYTLSPEVEGVTIKKDPSNIAKRLIVEVNGPMVLGSNWDKGASMSFTLTVDCEQEPDKTHSTSFNVNISPNNAPIILKQIDGVVADKLGETVKLNLDGVFFDNDGETLNYSISKTDLGEFKMNGSQLTFTASAYGTDVITVKATDMFGASISEDLQLLVRDGSRKVDLYPNPVIDKLNIRTSDQVSADVKIYSLSGACVFDSKLDLAPFSPATVDMSSMPAGSYTVMVVAKGIEVSEKVVKI